MAVPDFSIGQGMLLPVLQMTFSDGTGAKVPYSAFAGASVLFNLFAAEGQPPLVSAAGAFVLDADGTTADLTYTWAGADTAQPPGTYLGEFIVTFASGKKQKFPMGLARPVSVGSWIQIAIEPVA